MDPAVFMGIGISRKASMSILENVDTAHYLSWGNSYRRHKSHLLTADNRATLCGRDVTSPGTVNGRWQINEFRFFELERDCRICAASYTKAHQK